MERHEQVRQIHKLLHRLDTGGTVDAGGVIHNPMTAYTDPHLAERERQQFFHSRPHVIGLSGDLPEPNSFLTCDDLAVPVLATRDADGTFGAFVNACRHRGVRVETRGRGSSRRFTCRFHAWTYDSGGTLVGLPMQEHFGDIDRECHGLIRLPAVERNGLLWIHPDPNGSIDVEAALTADLDAELGSYGLDTLAHIGGDTYDVACNWKLAMDTFGETYHFSSLHKDTLFGAFHGNVQCYDTFGSNHRMLLCRRDIDDMRTRPEAEWDIRIATLPVYWLFPNVQLMPSQYGLYLVRAYPHPTDPGRHTSQITFYLRPEMAADPDFADAFVQVSQGFANVIRDEDYDASADQQRTAESGAVTHSVFGRNEPALHHYHNPYRRDLGIEPLAVIDA